MTDTTRAEGIATVPWLTSDPRMPVPDTSMLPAGEKPPSAEAALLKNAVPEKTDAWRDATDAWLEGVRSTVRGNPLAYVAAALVLGAVIARFTR